MSEINEGNCVLSNADIKSIEYVFCQHKLTRDLKSKKQVTKTLDSIYLKIKKLNDLETLAKAVMEYCNEEVGRSEGVGVFYGDDWEDIVEYCFLPALNQEDKKFE